MWEWDLISSVLGNKQQPAAAGFAAMKKAGRLVENTGVMAALSMTGTLFHHPARLTSFVRDTAKP
jgi:hypothetical protein